VAPTIKSNSCEWSRAFVDAGAEIFEEVVAAAHGEGDQRHGGGFVGLRGEDARVAYIKVGDVVSLAPLVGDGSFRIIAHAADADFMQAGARAIGLGIGAPHFAAGRSKKIDYHLLGVFPHQKFVFAPLVVETELGNTEDVCFVRIDIDVVFCTGERRGPGHKNRW
jgi:hypothetical protein